MRETIVVDGRLRGHDVMESQTRRHPGEGWDLSKPKVAMKIHMDGPRLRGDDVATESARAFNFVIPAKAGIQPDRIRTSHGGFAWAPTSVGVTVPDRSCQPASDERRLASHTTSRPRWQPSAATRIDFGIRLDHRHRTVTEKEKYQPACKPGSVWKQPNTGLPSVGHTSATAIHLGRLLPDASCNQPGQVA